MLPSNLPLGVFAQGADIGERFWLCTPLRLNVKSQMVWGDREGFTGAHISIPPQACHHWVLKDERGGGGRGGGCFSGESAHLRTYAGKIIGSGLKTQVCPTCSYFGRKTRLVDTRIRTIHECLCSSRNPARKTRPPFNPVSAHAAIRRWPHSFTDSIGREINTHAFGLRLHQICPNIALRVGKYVTGGLAKRTLVDALRLGHVGLNIDFGVEKRPP